MEAPGDGLVPPAKPEERKLGPTLGRMLHVSVVSEIWRQKSQCRLMIRWSSPLLTKWQGIWFQVS